MQFKFSVKICNCSGLFDDTWNVVTRLRTFIQHYLTALKPYCRGIFFTHSYLETKGGGGGCFVHPVALCLAAHGEITKIIVFYYRGCSLHWFICSR